MDNKEDNPPQSVDDRTLQILAERAKRLVYEMHETFGRDPDVADFLMDFREEIARQNR